ncbi:ABC transporter ATP-binding protein YxdL [Andreesenia angusta]|uniref:ABC transporter ATP-binding protein YxdL n=2 Tax=Andreesenia angusta TaxID=39480 RepID=A0A1S1V5J0_9FIRM|nr:ABC transporter ATP-binding protein YxdL [Andreesenia angusta]
MINREKIVSKKIADLRSEYPFVDSFFEDNKLDLESIGDMSFREYLNSYTLEEIDEWAIDTEKLEEDLAEYISQMVEFLGLEKDKVESLTILAGVNKSGETESFGEFTIKRSEIVSIVGPTGSGKSRLLADIEWAADGDTPTKRRILVNGETPDKSNRFSTSNKLVAQLSQNMNFVMDLTVREFLELHAKSRLVENVEEMVQRIVEAANELAGEKFSLDTAVTGLSGGQSRALMIADTAILSTSPIVLIDEIENAGIDRKKALDVLVNEEKIVLMATHDPSLALMADRRIVIKNGGIKSIIETGPEEKARLSELEAIDKLVSEMRTKLRNGETVGI